MGYLFPLCKQLYSVKEERRSIFFIPGGNGVLFLSNGILRNAHNNNNHSEEETEIFMVLFSMFKLLHVKGHRYKKVLSICLY